MGKFISAVFVRSWALFRRMPLIIQAMFWAASLGAFLMGLFVGNVGLAMMGGAIGVSGIAVGGVLGIFAVLVPWATATIVKAKRRP
jgi:hypothetical protein